MTQVNDGLRVGAAGTPTDVSGRRLPADRLLNQGTGSTFAHYDYANGGVQTQPLTYWDNLGVAPLTLAATGVCAAQAVSAAGNASINGTLATGGVATFDVPRCPTAKSSNAGDTTQTVTFTGTDGDGVTLTSLITLNGTSTVIAKKAFLTITNVAVSASLAGNLSAGDSDTFGLPWAVAGRRQLITAWGAPPADVPLTTGTLVAGDTTSPATSSTGDVRGTFAVPDSSNGTKVLAFWIAMNQQQANNANLAIGVAQA